MNLFKHIPWFRKPAAINRGTVWMEQQMKGNPLWGANPDRLVSAVTAWDAGYISELARIVAAYEMHDDVAKIGVRKRDAAVARCEHTVLIEEGFEDDPRAQRHKDILTRFWATVRVTSAFNRAERGGVRLLKKQMMSAQSIGWSCHNIVWDTHDPREIKAQFIHLPMWHFENVTGELRFKTLATDIYGQTMAEGEWLVHTGDAIGPAVALACCAKRLSLQDWMLFSERAATPGLLGKTSAAPGTEAWNNLAEMLQDWGRAWTGITDRDTDITHVNLNTGEPPMVRLVERMDRAIAALYRGADLSTISKGEGLGASLQGEESDMLEIDDCISLSESLHEQVDRFVIRYMTGDAEPLAYIWIEPVSKPNIEAEISVDNHLMSAGVKLSKRDMLQRYGRAEAAPDDPDDVAELQQPQNTPGTGFDAPQIAPRRFPNAATPLQTLANRLQNARSVPDGQRGVFPSARSEGPSRASGATDAKAALAALAEDSSEVAKEIAKLMADPSPSAASALLEKLPSLLPEDPALAAVIAEAMAEAYGEGLKVGRDVPVEPAPSGAFANAITNPCPKCHRQMSADGTCSFCAKRQANHTAGKAAFDKVASTHADVIGAMERDSIGKIDFIWGNPGTAAKGYEDGEGVSHILKKHKPTANQIPGVIAYGDVYENAAEGKYYIVKKRYVVALRKKTGSNHYLITGFKADDPNYANKIRKECSLVEKGE